MRGYRVAVAIALLIMMAICGLSWWETHRWIQCMRYALGPVQVAPPEYCFEGAAQ